MLNQARSTRRRRRWTRLRRHQQGGRGNFFGPKSISNRFHLASKVKPQKSKGQNEEIKQNPETADNRPRSKAQEGREGRLGKCQREQQHYSAAVGSALSQVTRLAAPMRWAGSQSAWYDPTIRPRRQEVEDRELMQNVKLGPQNLSRRSRRERVEDLAKGVLPIASSQDFQLPAWHAHFHKRIDRSAPELHPRQLVGCGLSLRPAMNVEGRQLGKPVHQFACLVPRRIGRRGPCVDQSEKIRRTKPIQQFRDFDAGTRHQQCA